MQIDIINPESPQIKPFQLQNLSVVAGTMAP